ncbi:MAG: hypothetical protein HY537_14120 [Deltaproteobacteria bacterium]|nr:hypothetical protein [Deltaproteobacteria bacterium]
MKTGNFFAFLISGVFCAFILVLLPYDEAKVAGFRLQRLLQQQNGVEKIPSPCQLSQQADSHALLFMQRFGPKASASDPAVRCNLELHSAHQQRFSLKSTWVYVYRLFEIDSKKTLLERTITLNVPRPPCLLPFALFLLSVLFDVSLWGLGCTVASFFFLLGGANLIQASQLFVASSQFVLFSDGTFLGMALVLLWLSIQKLRSPGPQPMMTHARHEGTVHRATTAVIGLWNPLFFTALGSILFPFRKNLALLGNFLNAQAAFTCLSLYLLVLNFGSLQESLLSTLLLPRYFSFAILLSCLGGWFFEARSPQVNLWKMPQFRRGVYFVAIGLSAGRFLPVLAKINTFTLVGLSLTLSELSTIRRFHLTRPVLLKWARTLYSPCAILFISAISSAAAQQSGLVELSLSLWDPAIHPSAPALFTFLSGMGLGFLGGGFANSYYALFSFVPFHTPLIDACVLEGIVAGVLLSPISLYNCLPATQFQVPLLELYAKRVKQLWAPLLVGLIIFSAAAINSVSILRPVIFIFSGLVGLAFILQKKSWQLRKAPF